LPRYIFNVYEINVVQVLKTRKTVVFHYQFHILIVVDMYHLPLFCYLSENRPHISDVCNKFLYYLHRLHVIVIHLHFKVPKKKLCKRTSRSEYLLYTKQHTPECNAIHSCLDHIRYLLPSHQLVSSHLDKRPEFWVHV
jgi:hypothetical protein